MAMGIENIASETYNILVVDDDYDQAAMVSEFLRASGFPRVDLASDIQTLWGCLNREHYDIVFLDYMLPDGTGLDVLDGIMARGYQVPVIMITGQGNERVAAQAIQRGAVDYLIKGENYLPMLPALIRRVVRTYQQQASIQNSLKPIRYQALLLNNVRDAVVVWDLEGRITYWNQAAESLYGWSAHERLGQPVAAVYLPAFTPPVRQPQPGDTIGQHVERQFRTRDGRDIWVSSRTSTLYESGAGSRLIGYMDVSHDITERKLMETKNQATQTHLVQATRLATIGEMASGIAHQINNPLTTIIAEAQILLRQLPPEDAGYELAQAIEQAGWRLQGVVQHLIDFSRPATSTSELLSVNRTIEGAISLVGAHIQAVGVGLEAQLEAILPQVLGNERQLEDLWVLLLSLARDASHPGRAHKIQVRSKSTRSGAVIVEVRDDGKPVPADQLASIFEPDFTGSNGGRGTGLELSICREIVRQHGGEITADSTSDGETIFTVILPVGDTSPTLPDGGT